MPLSPMGILHTAVGIVALIAGFKLLLQHHRITFKSNTGKVYLVATLITAASALTIFRHGGFNAAHALGLLTLVALAAGVFLEKTDLLKGLTKYAVNICYSATILFHLIPTATEILTRFPTSAPLVSSLKDPLLQKTFLAIFVLFLVMLTWQLIWIRKQEN